MKTSDLLLLGIGVGLGYYGFKRYQQNKPKQGVAQTKNCEEQWNEKASTMKLSADALATAKANFLSSCSPTAITTT